MDIGVEHVEVGNVASRFANFTEAEDVFLCSSWSNATNDAIVGIDQKGDAFWKKAHTYWKSNKKDNFPDRTPVGLMQRFSKIKTDVSKFCSYLAQVESLSGYTADDKIARAKEMFYEFEARTNIKKKSSSKAHMFAFEHCWRVLKYDQKWLSINFKKKSTNPDVSPNSSAPAYISVEDEDASFTPQSDERPVGRKLAKEGRTKRKGKFAYDNSLLIEKIDQTSALNDKHHNDSVALLMENDKKMNVYLEMERENLEMVRENLDLKKRKFDMEKQVFDMDIALKEAEFINKDISSLTDPDQIIFYQAQKRKIRSKYQESLNA